MARRIGNTQTPSAAGLSDIVNLKQNRNYVKDGIYPTPDNDALGSVRFDGTSSYLARTPSTAGNRKTWTWSGWVKFTDINSGGKLFAAGTADTNGTSFGHLGSSPNLEATFQNYTIHSGTDYGWNSTLKLRDSSAWYHIVVIYDSSSGVGGMYAYINGVQVTNFATDYGTLPLNEQGLVNAVNSHTIGRHQTLNNSFFNGYLANIHFIDGLALDPTYFAYTDRETGQWKPKRYTGAFGTNGFYLPLDGRSFTPEELTNDSSDVYLLLKSNGTDGSGTFVDDTTNSSRTATTISKTNTPTHTTEIAGKYQSTTMKFTYNNYLYVLNSSPNRENIHNTNSLYTCYEFWAKFTGDMTQDCSIYFVYSYTSDYLNPYWGKEGNTTGYIRSFYQNNGGANGNWTKIDANYFGKGYNYPYFLTDGEWHHYAYEQHKNEFEVCYIDGYVAAVLPMSSASWADTNAAVDLCKITSNNGHTMYVDSFRITQSTTPRYAAGARDDSGNKNHYTLLQGRSYGQIDAPTTLNLKDSPQNTFATWNPLAVSTATFSNGNLNATSSSSPPAKITSTFAVSSGKYYMEVYYTESNNYYVGISADAIQQDWLGMADGNKSIGFWPYNSQTRAHINGVEQSFSTTTWVSGDIIGIKLDADNEEVSIYKNGNLVGSSVSYSSYGWTKAFFAAGNYVNGQLYNSNFGQDPTFGGTKTALTTPYTDANGIGEFYYPPPDGALALCTQNLESGLKNTTVEKKYYNRDETGKVLSYEGYNDYTYGTINDERFNTANPYGEVGSHNFGNDDYIIVPASSDFNFGTGDYTIEGWYKSVGNGNYFPLMNNWRGATNGGWEIYLTGGALKTYIYNSGSVISTHQTSLVAGLWYHIAVVRNSGIITTYVNGVPGTSTINGTGVSIGFSDQVNYIGVQASDLAGDAAGSMYDIRVVKGTAVYTGTFTPPTGKLTTTGGTYSSTTNVNTSITAGHTVFLAQPYNTETVNNTPPRYPRDEVGKVLDYNGNAGFVNRSPYADNSVKSFDFDGSGDYIWIDDSADFHLSNNDFTIECWAYFKNTGVRCSISSQGNSGGQDVSIGHSFQRNSDDKIRFVAYTGSGTSATVYDSGTTTVSANQWYHLVAVRYNDTLSIYINGVSVNSYSVTGISYFNSTNKFGLGAGGEYVAGDIMNGYISDYRFVKGTAVYTGAFTPPSGRLTTTGGTYPSTTNVNTSITAGHTVFLAQPYSQPATILDSGSQYRTNRIYQTDETGNNLTYV